MYKYIKNKIILFLATRNKNNFGYTYADEGMQEIDGKVYRWRNYNVFISLDKSKYQIIKDSNE